MFPTAETPAARVTPPFTSHVAKHLPLMNSTLLLRVKPPPMMKWKTTMALVLQSSETARLAATAAVLVYVPGVRTPAIVAGRGALRPAVMGADNVALLRTTLHKLLS